MRIEKEASLVRIDQKVAILEVEGGNELTLSKNEVSSGAKVGDRYAVVVMSQEQAVLEREELARTILTELLKND